MTTCVITSYKKESVYSWTVYMDELEPLSQQYFAAWNTFPAKKLLLFFEV